MTLDVLQDAVVCRGLPSRVMFSGQSVNGNHEIHLFNRGPFDRNRTHGARHNLNVHIASFDLRKDLSDFLIADKGFAADERNVNWSIRIDQLHDAVYELFSPKIAHLAENGSAAEVLIAICVTPRTCQWTF